MFSSLILSILLVVATVTVQGLTPRNSFALPLKQGNDIDEAHFKNIIQNNDDTTITEANTSNFGTEMALKVSRGGGFGSVVANVFVLLVRNPGLIFLGAASTIIKIYEEQIPFSKYLNGMVQLLGAAYVFYLLTKWQDSVEMAKADGTL
ncbi:unnamed protein product [Cylindrotheca closterium]|uniref:Uncharacterized protein n=1 Tax=Cylindrotheca closterium TaxID=2856 RepID=A0AAD2CQP3_9STRA|nr:unnamed protein product [Cylindrotheca closterium]